MDDAAPWMTEEFNGMPYRLVGRSGLRASNIGLGTWKIGYPQTGDGSRIDEKTAFGIFDRAVQLGVTFWDTANRYNAGTGNSERIIGKWMKCNPDQRRNIVLATKVFGGMDGRTPNHSRLSRANILDSVYACLKRLQVDYIDLLYFHAFDTSTPVEESLAAVEDLVKRDIIRYFGVSNFSSEQLKTYIEIEKKLSVRCRVIAVQNQYDILNGEDPSHKGVLDFCASSGISFIAWSPLAKGLLTGRYVDPGRVGRGDRLFDEGETAKYSEEVIHAVILKLVELARKWDMELSRLVLAYMLSLPGMGPVIPSSSSIRQLESNAAAGRLKLSDGQRELIGQVMYRL